jgi:hypothetical protein
VPNRYCHADESGQETRGRIYVVGCIVLDVTKDVLDELSDFCEQVEAISRKGRFKWGKAERKRRLEYIRRILSDPHFVGALRFAVFENTVKYDHATIDAIARATSWAPPAEKYDVIVYVDALSRTKRREYSNALNQRGIHVVKVQGVTKDENNALTRLADALAGMVRDVLDGDDEEVKRLYEAGLKARVIVQV